MKRAAVRVRERIGVSALESGLRPIFQRTGRNLGILLGGAGIASLFGLCSLALNTRGLGVAGLGVLATFQLYASIVARLSSFDTWQPFVKLGAEALNANDSKALDFAFKLGLALDLAAAAIAAFVAVALVLLVGPLDEAISDQTGAALFFCLTLLTGATSTAIGLIRILDQFRLISLISVVGSAVWLTLSGVFFLRGEGLAVYLYAAACVALAQNLTHIGVALLLLKQRTGRPPWVGPWPTRLEFLRFVRLAAANWGVSTVNMLRQSADALIISVIIGPLGMGVYAVARTLIRTAMKLADFARTAVQPEIAALVVQGQIASLCTLLSRLSLWGLLAGLACVITFAALGRQGIELAFGSAFEAAYWPTLTMMAFLATYLATLSNAPAIQYLAHPKRLVAINLALTGPALLLSWWTVSYFGIAAGGVGQLAFGLAWAVWTTLTTRKLLRNRSISAGTTS